MCVNVCVCVSTCVAAFPLVHPTLSVTLISLFLVGWASHVYRTHLHKGSQDRPALPRKYRKRVRPGTNFECGVRVQEEMRRVREQHMTPAKYKSYI